MPRLVVPVATMNARVPEAPSTPDALPHPTHAAAGTPWLSEARGGDHRQDRADQLVGGQRQQAGAVGDLGECDEEDPEAHARDGAVDERSPRTRRSIRRGLAGDQPDPRKGGEHTDPDQPAGTLAEGDAHQHRAGPRPRPPRSAPRGPSGRGRARGTGRCCRSPSRLRPAAPRRSPAWPGCPAASGRPRA